MKHHSFPVELPAPKPVVAATPKKKAKNKNPAVSLDNTKAELLAAAKSLGLDVPSRSTKADVLALIEEA